MLVQYETLTQALLQAPSSPIPLIATATIDSYINIARNQVAADAECIRTLGTLALAANQQGYAFSSIVTPGSAAGVGSVIAVRSAKIGGTPIDIRQWEWFSQYHLGSGSSGTPVRLAQLSQSVNGTLYFDPTPNAAFTATFDVVCLPIPLVNDSTPEAIPQLWTDAVPFYASWLGMMSAQRQADAEQMYQRYERLVRRGRQFATPSELPDNLPGGAGTQAASAHQTLSGQPQQGR